MTPHYEDESVRLFHGDCLDVLRSLPDNSVDSVVTDPPYAINFMGRKWDRFDDGQPFVCERCGNDDATTGYRLCTDCLAASDMEDLRGAAMLGQQSQNWNEKATHSRGYADNNNAAFGRWCLLWSRECLRVLRPGGHLLAFGGTRTWHRLACAVEDAGFEVRDSIAWLYGSGFPKSLDVSKAIDKAAGATREVVGTKLGQPGYSLTDGNGDHRTYGKGLGNTGSGADECAITAPATDAARQWQGWGTAMKPAFEPVVVARKPLAGTVAANVLAHSTGALNIDATRIGTDAGWSYPNGRGGSGWHGRESLSSNVDEPMASTAGRWPANVVLDENAAAELDRQSGTSSSPTVGARYARSTENKVYSGTQSKPDTMLGVGAPVEVQAYGDSGGASRFFYVAKAPTKERPKADDGTAHPTVKPLTLMRWLVRLVTPPDGTVLEPFAGSGTTVEACVIEGFRCIAVEREATYLPLIVARLTKPIALDLFGGEAS